MNISKQSESQLNCLRKEQLSAIAEHEKRVYTASNKGQHQAMLQRLQKRLQEIETALLQFKK